MRAREPGGARYSRLWRYAALSAPDGVVVDSFNGWNEGTQIEAAAEAAEGCGSGDGGGGEEKGAAASSSSSSSASSATALGPQCAPDVRSYSEGENSGGGGLSSSSSSSSGGGGREERSSSKSRQQQRQKAATPHLYMRLTASESARAAAVASRASGRIGYELPKALPSQLEARGGQARGRRRPDERAKLS